MTARDVTLAYSMDHDPAVFGRKGEYRCAKGHVQAPNILVYFAARHLDMDPEVTAFRHARTRFEFYHPVSQKVAGAYFDFDVWLRGGGRKYIYATPCHLLHTPVEDSKIEAAEAHAGLDAFQLITEPDLFGSNPRYMRSLVRFFLDEPQLGVHQPPPVVPEPPHEPGVPH